ncbi:SRPBCC family protein [Mycobacterium sp. OTB74]|uniref:SRPBCC family protein n=1 Tax=Mycobacterium sp. OTB74 TaxID=1853452 RepID=UPI002475396E|nr:SRPBCC family protein [Mycobacterium sp. OTB74]
MSNESTVVEVFRSVTVPLSEQQAFELFTERMTDYWPAEHSIGGSPFEAVVIEPRAGGRWYERGADGTECQWGRVADWQPPRKVVLLWQIGADWKFDPEFQTDVEITFTAEGPGHTRVDLRHTNLERYGDAAEQMRGILDSPGGWPNTLERFAEAAAAS